MARDSAVEYSFDQAQKLFGKGLEVIGRASGIESLYNYGKGVVEQQEEDIRQGNYQPEYSIGLREAYTQGGIGNALGWLGEKSQENLASSGVALVGGLAAALTAPFSVPAAALIGGATLVGSGVMGTGEVAEEMQQKTGDYNSAVAIGAGTIIGLLDRFGAGKVIPKDELLTMTGKQLIQALGAEGKIDAAREIGKRIGRATAYEGVTEGTQEGVVVGATALTGGEYTGLEVADKILEGVALGSTMGGGMTTSIEALRQGPGAVNAAQDFFSSIEPMGPDPRMAIAGASLLSPDRAQMQLVPPVPLTTSEILMNESTSNQGGSTQTPEQIQKINETNEATERNLLVNKANEADPRQNFFNSALTGPDAENSAVSPLRILLNNLKKQNGDNKKLGRDIMGDLRRAEKDRPGLVGFMGAYERGEETIKKAEPAQKVSSKDFGIAMKAAKGDYTKLDPKLYTLRDVTRASKNPVLSFNDKKTNTVTNTVTQNRGGEAYNSGLEEYLVRNKDKQLSYDEVINVFDQTRPQIKLEIRSKIAGQNPGGLLVNAANPEAGNTLDLSNVAALGPTLEITQRIKQNFVDENGDKVSDPNDFEVDSIAVISHDLNKVTVKSGGLEQSGTINALKVFQSNLNNLETNEDSSLGIGDGHDYYKKGAAYTRAMIVRRDDGKLYAVLEEVQDDTSRRKEEGLDVATPYYDMDDPNQTLEKTWTNRTTAIREGTIPRNIETEEIVDDFYKDDDVDPIARDKKIAILNDAKENRRPASLHSFKADMGDQESSRAGSFASVNTRNVFDASEKQKIIVMDQIEQDMPYEDSLTKLGQEKDVLQKKADAAQVKRSDLSFKQDLIVVELNEMDKAAIFPRQHVDLQEMLLDDLVNNENEFIGDIVSKIKDKAPIFGRDTNQDYYKNLEDYNGDTDQNFIAPIIEGTFDRLSKEGKLKAQLQPVLAGYEIIGSENNKIGQVQKGITNDRRHRPMLQSVAKDTLDFTSFGNRSGFGGSSHFHVLPTGMGGTSYLDSVGKLTAKMPGGIVYGTERERIRMQENMITGSDNPYMKAFYPQDFFKIMQETTTKNDSFKKTINMLMKEAINEQAVGVIKTKIANYIVKKHGTEQKGSQNVLPLTDMEELIKANYVEGKAKIEDTPQKNLLEGYNRVDHKGLRNDIRERLGEKANTDIERFAINEGLKMTKRIGFAPENGSFSDLFKPASLMTNPIDSSDKNKIQVLINDILEDLNDNSRKNEDIYTLIATTPYQRAAKVNDPKVKEGLQNSFQVATENMNKAIEEQKKLDKEINDLISRKELRRRLKALEKNIIDRAEEFNYSAKELLPAFNRMEQHLKGDKRYNRDSAHSSQAQASRAIIKGLINQLPELEALYKEPVVGLVVPARTDLQNMSGRAQLPPNDGSSYYQRELEKHKKAGLTSYQVAPNLVKKQYQDALLDAKGNPKIQVEEKNVDFKMVNKAGDKYSKLANPVQFILRLDSPEAQKLARSKFVFKAKGGTVDLRKAG
jgi:hypothetical protein